MYFGVTAFAAFGVGVAGIAAGVWLLSLAFWNVVNAYNFFTQVRS